MTMGSLPGSPRPLRRCLLSSLLLSSALAQVVIRPKWSDEGFGYDGPWPAVEVGVGSGQKVFLFPGHDDRTWLIDRNYCSMNSTDDCSTFPAGTFDRLRSNTEEATDWRPGAGRFMRGMNIQQANDGDRRNQAWLDTVSLDETHPVDEAFIILINGLVTEYPNGRYYPVDTGCLAVGGATVNQTLERDGYDPWYAMSPAGVLWEEGDLRSNSFGMHIGSASSVSVPGSLVYGGYDPNRVIGDVLEAPTSFMTAITLRSIEINVVDGASPFENADDLENTNLLATASGNGNSLAVSVDGCSPYLTLPKATCDKIAEQIPVSYDEGLGLYLWNRDDPRYELIVKSASALAFTVFARDNERAITVNVPFSHLNLTLTEPLVDDPTPYFPCFTGGQKEDEDDTEPRYVLGRAFLQDAFIGANWNLQNWYLAQAPGPNTQSSPRTRQLGEGDPIESGSNSWAESWVHNWKALTEDEIQTALDATPTPTPSGSEGADGGNGNGDGDGDGNGEGEGDGDGDGDGDGGGGLSTGAVAGIATGAAVAGLILLGVGGIILWRRKKNNKQQTAWHAPGPVPGIHDFMQENKFNNSQTPPGMMSPGQYSQGYQQYHQQQQYPAEMAGTMGGVEMPGDRMHLHEAPVPTPTAPTSGGIPPRPPQEMPS